MSDRAPDGAYDEWIAAIEAGAGHYLECSAGHGSLPPRRVCPHCGDRDLREEPIPEAGEVATYTEVQVPTPQFEDDAPYVTAIADFGPVSITGVLRGVDPEDVAIGDVVGIEVGERATTGDPVVVFRPR